MKIHHIGYLVKNIEKAEINFAKLGYEKVSEHVTDEVRQAEICFMQCSGYVVELISPHKDSDLYDLLKKYKNTAYHICYEVKSIADSMIELEQNGFHLFKVKEKAPAIGKYAYVAFFMNASIGMIELVEGIEE